MKKPFASSLHVAFLLLVLAVGRASAQIPHEGMPAPAFSLSGPDGAKVTLDKMLEKQNGLVLVFYRGYW